MGKGTRDLRTNSELPETAWARQARAVVHTSWQSGSLTLPLPTGPSRPPWCGDNCGERTRACDPMPTQAPPLARPVSGTALELTRLPLGRQNFHPPLCSKTLKNNKGRKPVPPGKSSILQTARPVAHGATRNHAENPEHHFRERSWFGAEVRGRDNLNNTTYLGEKMEGEETLQEMLTYRAQGRTHHRKAGLSGEELFPRLGPPVQRPIGHKLCFGKQTTLLPPLWLPCSPLKV